jgi:hypothetical protein
LKFKYCVIHLRSKKVVETVYDIKQASLLVRKYNNQLDETSVYKIGAYAMIRLPVNAIPEVRRRKKRIVALKGGQLYYD